MLAGTPVGNAFTPLVLQKAEDGRNMSLGAAITDARNKTDWRVWRRLCAWAQRNGLLPARTTQTSGESDGWKITLLGILSLYLVYLYAVSAMTVATVMMVVAIACVVSTLLTFTILGWRRVVEGQRTAWHMVMTITYGSVGILNAIWLIYPPHHPVLQAFVSRIDTNDLTVVAALGAAFASQPLEVPALALQMLGAVLSFIVLLSSIAVCIASVSSVYSAIGVRGARYTWTPAFWAVRWATGNRFWALALVTGALSLALTGGYALSGLIWLGDFVSSLVHPTEQQ